MTLTELQKLVHDTASEKGWHQLKRSPLEIHALIHSEVSEATEAARNPVQLPLYWIETHKTADDGTDIVDKKPEGEQVELADAVIRIMDYFQTNGWDLEKVILLKNEYNKTRAFRHGGKLY